MEAQQMNNIIYFWLQRKFDQISQTCISNINARSIRIIIMIGVTSNYTYIICMYIYIRLLKKKI